MAAPGKAAPGKAAPGKAVPGRAAPGRAAPGRAALGKAAPGKAAPEKAAPGEGRVHEGRSVETAAPGKKKGVLKVSKFQKKIFLLSFEPKNGQNYVLISALASKNWLNQKNEDSLLYKSGGILPLFFDLTNFKSLRQKSKNIFIRFFVSNEN
jgi:hypothetical protein